MSISTTSRTSRIINHVTEIWSELDYAQRRSLEIRTGVELTRRQPALEALYQANSPNDTGSPRNHR